MPNCSKCAERRQSGQPGKQSGSQNGEILFEQASKARDIEIVGFLWLQGGGDMKKVDVAKEYLGNGPTVSQA